MNAPRTWYADDFKLFCKCRSDAVRIFEATTMWLKERLGLEISPGKSKIVNLKKGYSDFIGFKLIWGERVGVPVVKQKMGAEIAHGRQGAEKVQGKYTLSHWKNRQRAKPTERNAVQRYGAGPA